MVNCAGIVIYNPDIVKLKENIEAIINQVDTLIVVDNASYNSNDIMNLLSFYSKVVSIRNDKNYGIAKALNQIVNHADELGYNWVLTLDQDSVCKPELLIKYNYVISTEDNIALVTSNYEDRNVSIEYCNSVNIEDVDFCITSGTFTNVKCIKDIGGFDEKMFIDMVDYDICYAIKKNGFRIVRINYVGFVHEVGQSKEHKLLGKKIIVFNHSALRKYYWTRNSIYLMKKYNQKRVKAFTRIIKRMISTLLFEKRRFSKIGYMIKGIFDGMKL